MDRCCAGSIHVHFSLPLMKHSIGNDGAHDETAKFVQQTEPAVGTPDCQIVCADCLSLLVRHHCQQSQKFHWCD